MMAYRLFRLVGLVAPETLPPTVTAFMAGAIVVYVLSLLMQGPSAIVSPTPETLSVLGAWRPSTALVPGQMWRALAFGLVHFGIIHIGFNMFALSQIGPVLEADVGKVRILTAITASQLAAMIASFAWYAQVVGRNVPTVGASGWLFGLIGFGIAYYHGLGRSGQMYRSFLIRWAIYGLVFGWFIGANNAAHIGGMLGGMLIGALPSGHMRRPQWTLFWSAAALASLLLWLVTLGFLAHSIITGWAAGAGGA
jgi:rhomboid protease GluP